MRAIAGLAGALLLAAAPPPSTRSTLQSGPMVGYSEMREVLLWAQTTGEATVKFVYWDEAEPALRLETAQKRTAREEAFTARLIADRVEPGRRYGYELWLDGARVERPYPLRFRTRSPRGRQEPPEPVKIALGSCFWVNDPRTDGPQPGPGADYHVFASIAAQKPDLMLWLGDNVYMRESDWSSRTGMLYRYTQTRSLPELQPLLGAAHHYAVWDDHDYGPNDSDRSFRDKAASREAFMLFWGNQAHGVEGSPGITSRFAWEDVEVFLLDNRWNRSPNLRSTGRRQVLGEAQIEWLIDALASSTATFKLVAGGGQVLNPVPVAETYATFKEEREELIRRITEEGARGVVLLSGDRHFSELGRLDRPGSYPLYELTVSPLTTWVARPGEREPNGLRVPGTLVTERNFATIDVGGPRGERELRFTVFDVNGAPRWSRVVRAAELREARD